MLTASKKTSTEGSFHDDHIETQFIPDDYDSGDEIASQANKDPGAIHHEGLSTASIQLMEK